MTKFSTLLSTVALACTLAMPVLAQPKSAKAAKAQDTTAAKAQGTTAMTTAKKAKSHKKHASKSSVKKSDKMQQGSNPTPSK
jgi:hypothetical protein